MNAGIPVASVEGHRITLTHLNKVLYPETGATKADARGYYAAIADVLIPHAANRRPPANAGYTVSERSTTPARCSFRKTSKRRRRAG